MRPRIRTHVYAYTCARNCSAKTDVPHPVERLGVVGRPAEALRFILSLHSFVCAGIFRVRCSIAGQDRKSRSQRILRSLMGMKLFTPSKLPRKLPRKSESLRLNLHSDSSRVSLGTVVAITRFSRTKRSPKKKKTDGMKLSVSTRKSPKKIKKQKQAQGNKQS